MMLVSCATVAPLTVLTYVLTVESIHRFGDWSPELSAYCRSRADGELGWIAGRVDCCDWRVHDLCQEEVSVHDGTWWKLVVGAEWMG